MIKYVLSLLKDTRDRVTDGSDVELKLTNEKETELLMIYNFKQYQDIVNTLDRATEELDKILKLGA